MIGSQSKTVETAIAILEVLSQQDDWMHQADLRTEVVMEGGDLTYLHEAAKWLRDRGIPVDTIKQGKDSVWGIAATPGEFDEYMTRALKEWYSEAVSEARAAGGMANAGKVRMRAVTNAVVLGERLGIDPAVVVEECKPLAMPPGISVP